jgi:hypothetical protein
MTDEEFLRVARQRLSEMEGPPDRLAKLAEIISLMTRARQLLNELPPLAEATETKPHLH